MGDSVPSLPEKTSEEPPRSRDVVGKFRPVGNPSRPSWPKEGDPASGLVSLLAEPEVNSKFGEAPAPLEPSRGSAVCGNPSARRMRDGLWDGGCSGSP